MANKQSYHLRTPSPPPPARAQYFIIIIIILVIISLRMCNHGDSKLKDYPLVGKSVLRIKANRNIFFLNFINLINLSKLQNF